MKWDVFWSYFQYCFPEKQSNSGFRIPNTWIESYNFLAKIADKCVKISDPCLVVQEMKAQFKENGKCFMTVESNTTKAVSFKDTVLFLEAL